MKAERDNPPFDRAPVDGYACKAEDLAGALPEKQVTLKVIREVDAGEYFDGTVQHGEAVPLPALFHGNACMTSYGTFVP